MHYAIMKPFSGKCSGQAWQWRRSNHAHRMTWPPSAPLVTIAGGNLFVNEFPTSIRKSNLSRIDRRQYAQISLCIVHKLRALWMLMNNHAAYCAFYTMFMQFYSSAKPLSITLSSSLSGRAAAPTGAPGGGMLPKLTTTD